MSELVHIFYLDYDAGKPDLLNDEIIKISSLVVKENLEENIFKKIPKLNIFIWKNRDCPANFNDKIISNDHRLIVLSDHFL